MVEHLVERLVSHDREEGAENLLLGNAHLFVNIQHQVGREFTPLVIETLSRELYSISTFGYGIIESFFKAGVRAFIDNRCVIISISIRVALTHNFTGNAHEFIALMSGYKNVVRGDTGLPSVDVFAVHNATNGLV